MNFRNPKMIIPLLRKSNCIENIDSKSSSCHGKLFRFRSKSSSRTRWRFLSQSLALKKKRRPKRHAKRNLCSILETSSVNAVPQFRQMECKAFWSNSTSYGTRGIEHRQNAISLLISLILWSGRPVQWKAVEL